VPEFPKFVEFAGLGRLTDIGGNVVKSVVKA
jgi:hypothetical protein